MARKQLRETNIHEDDTHSLSLFLLPSLSLSYTLTGGRYANNNARARACACAHTYRISHAQTRRYMHPQIRRQPHRQTHTYTVHTRIPHTAHTRTHYHAKMPICRHTHTKRRLPAPTESRDPHQLCDFSFASSCPVRAYVYGFTCVLISTYAVLVSALCKLKPTATACVLRVW